MEETWSPALLFSPDFYHQLPLERDVEVGSLHTDLRLAENFFPLFVPDCLLDHFVVRNFAPDQLRLPL